MNLNDLSTALQEAFDAQPDIGAVVSVEKDPLSKDYLSIAVRREHYENAKEFIGTSYEVTTRESRPFFLIGDIEDNTFMLYALS